MQYNIKLKIYVLYDYEFDSNIPIEELFPVNMESSVKPAIVISDVTYEGVLALIDKRYHDMTFIFTHRRNGTFRPSKKISQQSLNYFLSSNEIASIKKNLYLYVYTRPPPKNEEKLVFVKYFESGKYVHAQSRLINNLKQLIGTNAFDRITTFSCIACATHYLTKQRLPYDIIIKIINLTFSDYLVTQKQDCTIFEEVRTLRRDKLDFTKSLESQEISNGDILHLHDCMVL